MLCLGFRALGLAFGVWGFGFVTSFGFCLASTEGFFSIAAGVYKGSRFWGFEVFPWVLQRSVTSSPNPGPGAQTPRP